VASSAFSLGWVMAQLFDERRLAIDELFSPPFDPSVQLPLVADLDLARRRELALTDLSDLIGAVVPGVAADKLSAVKTAGLAATVSQPVLAAGLQDLHQAILDQLVDNDQQISAYQLGLTLSDTCWLPTVAGGAETFMVMFQRGQVAALKTWLAAAGDTIPAGSAGIPWKTGRAGSRSTRRRSRGTGPRTARPSRSSRPCTSSRWRGIPSWSGTRRPVVPPA
jgi:hypothetical protein